jgi:hypothetical protein
LASQSTEAAAAADDPNAVQASERLRQAAEHVLLAQEEMEAAGGALGAPDLPVARQAQDLALEELREALEILEPPGEENSQQEQQQDQEQQQEQQGQGQDDQAQAEPGRADPSLAADPAQLLQEVRDREAQRRRDRARGSSPYETVEKDW